MSVNVQLQIHFHIMNGAKSPIDTEPITTLNMKIPFLPSANNKSFAQYMQKLINSFNTLIQLNMTKSKLVQFTANIRDPISFTSCI